MSRLSLTIAALSALIFAACAAAPGWAETEFVEPLGDVPLMPGLMLVPEETVSFDTPAGRIVETVVRDTTSRLDGKAIADFYAASLPQLGWTAAGANVYTREGELLRLEIGRKGAAVRVRFFLKPG